MAGSSNAKRLHLTDLTQECRALLDRAGDLVEVNLSEDPQYHVATDRIIPSLTKQPEQIQSDRAPARVVAG